jgi:AcrR family transcriptional regulator
MLYTMSSTATRERILSAARTLLEDGHLDAGLERVAKAAGVSRQAIYLHFGSRPALLLALVDFVDESEGLSELSAQVRVAPTGAEALDRLVRMNATYEPRIRAVALAHDIARRSDPDLEAAWQDRMERRRSLYAGVVKRLADERELSGDLSQREAVDLIWALLSPRVHEDLVVDRGWSRKRYESRLTMLLHAALLADDRAGARVSGR